ncbi:hypothetical protein Tco_0738635 [Tanacetum coccineum]
MDGRTCNIKQKCVMNQIPRQLKRGQDTKIPQSSGPPEKVGDEAIHKELGDRMERAATTASSLEAEQDSDAQTSIKVKEFQRSFRHSDTERLSRSDEVLKLKNFKKDATLKLSKSTNQEWYEHVGPEVTRSQDDKVTRWRNEIMLG